MSRWLKASAEIKYVVKRKQYDPELGKNLVKKGILDESEINN